jgi:hypothetical protein
LSVFLKKEWTTTDQEEGILFTCDKKQLNDLILILWELACKANSHGLQGEQVESLGVLPASGNNYFLIINFFKNGVE